ncbi:MAG: hypothetical protein JKY52_20700 [Flavobacteriales bacterium]|nr:hypothetical protein [Flavobacteriales bacterium]
MRILLLSLTFLFLSGSLDAQIVSIDAPAALVFEQWYKGSVTTNDNETLEGEIQWINRQYNQRRVNFRSAASNKVYTKDDLKSYTINGQAYQFVNDPNYGKRYVARAVEGGLSVYYYYILKSESAIKGTNTVEHKDDGKVVNHIAFTKERNDADFEEVMLIKRHDAQKFINLSAPAFAMSFKKAMSNLVDDYAELASKIKNKEKGYKMLQRDKIILEYNEWYAKS